MQALLVIDMQEDYIGNKRNQKRFPYNSECLIENINQRILWFVENDGIVIYIVNRFIYQGKKFKPQPVKGLSIVSSFVFEKRQADCFSVSSLLQCLKENLVDEVELVGVDGQYCVGMSALGAIRHNFSVRYNENCVGVRNGAKFTKMKNRLENAGVAFIYATKEH